MSSQRIEPSPSSPLLEFIGIEKSFARVHVLKQVSFALQPGHTLGLVGENGAGKSTLMNILGGNHSPDAGEMRFAGRTYAPRRPTDASARGIAFIHQELNLFSNLSIAENIFLTAFPRRAGLPWIDRGTTRERARLLLEQVGLALSPDTLVERLSAGERQLVEIAKALSLNPRLIIFDEPTTSLSTRETESLFQLMARLRQRGIAMIYISHILDDVLRLCDDIVVLRDGQVIEAGRREIFTADHMISLMVGRSLTHLYPERQSRPASQPVLELKGVSEPNSVHQISFTLHRGEILGLAGLMGAGRSELARILFGLEPCARGEILIEGRPLTGNPRERIQRGVAFLTEDRRSDGLFLEASVADNIALVTLRNHTRSPLRLIDKPGWKQTVAAIRGSVRLSERASDLQPAKTLSGGNQQKLVLAKWLLARPSVFILDEPTRGIDVGARFEIYQLIHELADQGAGILMISSEIEELIGVCDRILVMRRGEIRDVVARPDFNRERILRSAL